MAYLYHAFVSVKSDSADTTLVRPTNWNDRLEYSNFAATGPSGTDAFIREVLTAARTYYVRTDGSDSNTGLVNTAGGAFLTIQKAIDVIVANLDLGGFTVTIQVADGTYTGNVTISSPWLNGPVTIQGNTGTPGNVIWAVTGNNALVISAPLEGLLTIDGVILSTTVAGSCVAFTGSGTVQFARTHWGACASDHCFLFSPAAIAQFANSYSITGSAAGRHIYASGGAFIDRTTNGAKTITLTGTPSFSTFVVTENTGFTQDQGNTYSGGATGTRFTANSNSVIQTNGGGANYFPGNVAGGTASGGQYL